MRTEVIQNSRILIVDDQPENILLLERMLKEAGYKQIRGITDSRIALATFIEFVPDLVAIDLRMPHVDGFSLLRQLRLHVPAGAFVPMLVLTADNSRKSKQEALSIGAKDFVTKPLDMAETLLRIYNLLETRWLHVQLQAQTDILEQKVRDRTRDLEEAQQEILQRLALAAEYRDDCTGRHTQRVGELAALLGREIGLPTEEVEVLRRAAPLHDVGKIGIPDGILLKPAALTPNEYAHIKTHTDIGRVILSGSKFQILQMAERIALYHHERWDGNGYHRIGGEQIPLEARIVSVVDVFDVITHSRPYKEAASIEVAIERIQEERGKQFDPALVDSFCGLQPETDIHRLGSALQNDEKISDSVLDRVETN